MSEVVIVDKFQDKRQFAAQKVKKITKKLSGKALNPKQLSTLSNDPKPKTINFSAKSSLINAVIFHAKSKTIENTKTSSNIELDCSYKKRSNFIYAKNTKYNGTVESRIMDLSQITQEKKDKISKVNYQACTSCTCTIY